MPVRMLQYVAALYDHLLRSDTMDIRDGPPRCCPSCSTNGDARWTHPAELAPLIQPHPRRWRRFSPACASGCWTKTSGWTRAGVGDGGDFRFEHTCDVDSAKRAIRELANKSPLAGPARAGPSLDALGAASTEPETAWHRRHPTPSSDREHGHAGNQYRPLENRRWPGPRARDVAGHAAGMQQGIQQGMASGIEQGRQQGLAQGERQLCSACSTGALALCQIGRWRAWRTPTPRSWKPGAKPCWTTPPS